MSKERSLWAAENNNQKERGMAQIFRSALCVAGNSLHRQTRSVSFYGVIFFTFLFWELFTWNIKGLAQAGGYGITPYLLPHFFASGVFEKYGLFLLILLTCDAPFMGENSLYAIYRSGKMTWVTGKILYIFALNIIFQLILFLSQLIVLLPNAGISREWGSVLYTAAKNPESISGYSGYGSVSDSLISAMTSAEAVAKQMLLCIFLGSVIGVITFFINGLTKKAAGSVIMVGAVLASDFLEHTDRLFGTSYAKHSPFGWLNLESYVNGNYKYGTNLVWLAVIFAVCVILTCAAVKGNRIKLTE